MGFGGGYRRTSVRRDYVDEPDVVSTRRGVVRERTVVRDDEVI